MQRVRLFCWSAPETPNHVTHLWYLQIIPQLWQVLLVLVEQIGLAVGALTTAPEACGLSCVVVSPTRAAHPIARLETSRQQGEDLSW